MELTFDIREGRTEVTSRLHVKRREASSSEIQLDGQELELVSVAVDGRLLSGNEYTRDSESLRIPGLGDGHVIDIVTGIEPEKTRL